MVRKFYDIVPNYGGGALEFGEWQLCPKCGGQGTVSKPPYLPGDVYEWSGTGFNFTCDVCNGVKLIQRPLLTQTIPSGSNTVTNTEEK